MNLMIIDDDKQIREGISRGIKWEAIGIDQVAAFQDGIDAVKAFPEFMPDIVLCDVCMPEMNGIEFLREVKWLNPDIRVILISGYSDFEYVQQAIKLGAIDYELKPLNARSLIRRVTDLRDEILKERNSSILQLKYRQEYKRNTFQKILKGEIEDYNITKEFFENHYGLENLNEFLMMLMIQDYGEALSDEDGLLSAVESELNEKYGGDGVIIKMENKYLVLVKVVNSALYIQERSVGLARLFQRLVKAYPKQKITAVLSGMYSIRRLSKAYKNLEKLGEYRFYTGPGQLLEESKTECKEEIGISVTERGKALIQAAAAGQDCTELVDAIGECWRRSLEPSPAEIKSCLMGWLYELASQQQGLPDPAAFAKRMEGMSYLEDILEEYKAFLSRSIAAKLERERSHYGHTVGAAVKFLQEHYREAVSVEQVAKYVQKSPNYFSALFKKETGVTFSQYMNQLRIAEAKRLLRETILPLSEIAVLAGYTDYAYFVSVFKKLEGCSPSSLRKKM